MDMNLAFHPPKIEAIHRFGKDVQFGRTLPHHFNSRIPLLGNLFTGSVTFAFPNSLHTPQEIKDAMKRDADWYEFRDCDSEILHSRDFLEFVKLSSDFLLTDLEGFVLTFTGSKLGLYDQYSTKENFIKANDARPFQQFDIQTGRSHFVNAIKAHEMRRGEKLDKVWISWYPKDKSVCPSSICKFMVERFGLNKVKRIAPEEDQIRVCRGEMPDLNSEDPSENFSRLQKWIYLSKMDRENMKNDSSSPTTQIIYEISGLLNFSKVSECVQKFISEEKESRGGETTNLENKGRDDIRSTMIVNPLKLLSNSHLLHPFSTTSSVIFRTDSEQKVEQTLVTENY